MSYTRGSEPLELSPPSTITDRDTARAALESVLDYLTDLAGVADLHGWVDIADEVLAVIDAAEARERD